MKITVCRCIPIDYVELHALNINEMGYSSSEEQTKSQLSKILTDTSNAVFVALYDDKVIGYIHGAEYNLIYAEPMVNVLGIAVGAEYKKKGVGKALLSALEDWARERDIHSIRLTSGTVRTDAHVFYEKCGFIFKKNQRYFTKTLY